MEEIRFNSTLVVLGGILCGKDGILDAAGSVTWMMMEDLTKEELVGMFKGAAVINGNYDLSGKRVLVMGSVFVYGNIVYDQNWEGRVVAYEIGNF